MPSPKTSRPDIFDFLVSDPGSQDSGIHHTDQSDPINLSEEDLEAYMQMEAAITSYNQRDPAQDSTSQQITKPMKSAGLSHPPVDAPLNVRVPTVQSNSESTLGTQLLNAPVYRMQFPSGYHASSTEHRFSTLKNPGLPAIHPHVNHELSIPPPNVQRPSVGHGADAQSRMGHAMATDVPQVPSCKTLEPTTTPNTQFVNFQGPHRDTRTTPSKHSITSGQVQGSRFASNLPTPRSQRKPPTMEQMLAHTQRIEFENRELKKSYGWTVKVRENYQRLVNQNQELKAALKMKTEELGRLLRHARLMENAFMNANHRRPTTAELFGVHSGQAPPSNTSTVVPQQPSMHQPNLNQVSAIQRLVPTVALSQCGSLDRQQEQPAAWLQGKTQNFVRPPGPDNAYPTPPLTSPEYNNPPVFAGLKNGLNMSQEVIDLTSDELKTHPSVTQNATNTTVSNVIRAFTEPPSQASRKHYIAATGQDLGGPKKVPSWVVQGQADMKIKIRDQAIANAISEMVKGKRKSEAEDHPSKKARTQQSAEVAKTTSEKSNRQRTKRPRESCTPSANPVSEHQTASASVVTLTDSNGTYDDEDTELIAALEAELDAMSRAEGENDPNAEFNNGER